MSISAFKEAKLDNKVSTPTTIENAKIRMEDNRAEMMKGNEQNFEKYSKIVESFFNKKTTFSEMNLKALNDFSLDAFAHMVFVFSSAILKNKVKMLPKNFDAHLYLANPPVKFKKTPIFTNVVDSANRFSNSDDVSSRKRKVNFSFDYEPFRQDTNQLRKKFLELEQIMRTGKKWEGDPDFVEEPLPAKKRSEFDDDGFRIPQIGPISEDSDSDSSSDDSEEIYTVLIEDEEPTGFAAYRNAPLRFC